MAPHTAYILLQIVLSILSLNIVNLKYEVSGDQFCGTEVTGIDPVTY